MVYSIGTLLICLTYIVNLLYLGVAVNFPLVCRKRDPPLLGTGGIPLDMVVFLLPPPRFILEFVAPRNALPNCSMIFKPCPMSLTCCKSSLNSWLMQLDVVSPL